MVCLEVAYQVLTVAASWHIFTLRRNPLDLGLIGLALFAPVVLFALPAGVFVDRHDRRAIAIVTAFGDGLTALAFAVAIALGVRLVGVYLAILLVSGTARAFGGAARRALLFNIVERTGFVQANASYNAIRQGLAVAGPALGGILVSVTMTLALVATAIFAAGAALALGALRFKRAPSDGPPPSWRDALGGIRFIFSRRVVAGVILL